MNILLLGLSHKTAPISVREQLHFAEEHLVEFLKRLGAMPAVEEAFLLSTCNRTEICARVQDAELSAKELRTHLGDYRGVPLSSFEGCLYTYRDAEAVRHLFRVASSLDSLVVGEAQILGQVKAAYQAAKEGGVLGPVLHQVLERAFTVAKRVRTETRISENAVSVSYAAVELSRKIFGDLADKRVMLIGAGEMAELAARHLLSNGVKSLLVCNRTFSRAVELAEGLGGDAIRFEHLQQRMAQADIIISSTAAGKVIVNKDEVQHVIRQRKNKPMFFIDIAVPRDIDAAVNEIDHVFLYNLDDLESVIETNIKERQREAVRAEEIVQSEVAKFLAWFDARDVTPTIVALREKFEHIRRAEVERFVSRNGRMSEADIQALEQLTTSLLNKFLHAPLVSLKQQGSSDGSTAYAQTIRQLFQLDR